MVMVYPTFVPRSSVETPVLRVASVPSGHVYVRHLSPPDGVEDGVLRLQDPEPSGAESPEQWWPPVMLEPGWVDSHHDEFDVFHIHFGFDAKTPQQLEDLVHALHRHGKPLVLTAHDLRNPHHRERSGHDAQLDVLVPAADGLMTLTPGAAHEIEQRWARTPIVVPHPHVVSLDRMSALQRQRASRGQRESVRIGLHVKSLRACMDPGVVIPGLERAVNEIDDAILQIDGHTDVLDPSGDRFDRDLFDLLRNCGDRVEVRVHDYFDDEQLWSYLSSLDVSVLPYRFGTHSGWLEACRDLGTAVVAPTCGYYSQQGPVESFLLDEQCYDEGTLVDAVLRATERPAAQCSIVQRARERHEIAATHRSLYEALAP
jgi:beta-1,4-mannosyltransferase